MELPSGENATVFTASVCPRKGSPMGFPVAASHSRKVWSSEPETMRLPSGEKAALKTPPVCPWSVPTSSSCARVP